MIHCSDPHPTRCCAMAAYCIAFACVVASVESRAQDADTVTIDAARCLELEAPNERLACFEGQVDEARASGRSNAAAPVPPRNSQAPVPAAAAPDRTVDLADQPQKDRADAQSEWVGIITALSFRVPNRYLVTLDNGQMWEQQVAERYPLQVGQRVHVYQSRWGKAYRLEADGKNGFIQVARVR